MSVVAVHGVMALKQQTDSYATFIGFKYILVMTKIVRTHTPRSTDFCA